MKRRNVITLIGQLFLSLSLCLSGVVESQQPTRDNYYDYLPPFPKIVGQSEASVRLNIFGDASAADYQDRDPADGIDDVRAQRLLEIAERFSPILRRNNFVVPLHYLDATINGPVLLVDTWRDGVRVHSDSVDLRLWEDPAASRVSSDSTPSGGAIDDVKLDALIRELHPKRVEPVSIPPTPEVEKIIFFDLPGADEATWRATYAKLDRSRSKIHAHFLIHEPEGATGNERYELAVQFWFFYPFNDAANNHEGDWEHISVSITTKDRGTRPNRAAETAGLLSADEIGRILDNGDVSIVDSLIIWKVDYYFHHHVMTLNYFTSSVHRPYIGPGTVRLGADMWEDPSYVDDVVQRRLTYAGGRLATHPIGFIGGNSKGVDELLSVLPRLKWSYNRNSGATYPFPGTWQTVGPFGATEKVHGRDVPPIRKLAVEEQTRVPWHDLVDDDSYLVYRSASIVLLPDWERIADLVLENAEIRRQWAWLILPMRFGFPIVQSPGAGVLKKTNLGNLAAVAPPFTTGWNRVGPTSNFHVYAPYVLRVPLATSNPFATSQSGLGALNLAALAWALTPGGNVAVATIMPWAGAAMHVLGYPPPRTFATGPVKLRFTTEGQGVVYRFGGDGFARMLPRRESASLSQLLAPDTSWLVDEASLRRDAGAAPHVLLDLHFTRRLSIENTFSWDVTELTQTIRTPEGVPIGTVRGLLNHRELTGGFRFNVALFLEDALQLYTRGGYAWTWYKLHDVSLGETRLGGPPVRGGYAPTLWPSHLWWPNTWLGGAGVELFSPKRMRLFQTRTLGYGVRIDLTVFRHRLDPDTPGQRGNAVATWGEASIATLLGW